jgi:hypothetical protein
MKKYLLLILAALGLLALVSTKSRAQDFSFGVSVGRAITLLATVMEATAIPGMGITIDAFITALPTIGLITTATASTATGTTSVIGTTMIKSPGCRYNFLALSCSTNRSIQASRRPTKVGGRVWVV